MNLFSLHIYKARSLGGLFIRRTPICSAPAKLHYINTEMSPKKVAILFLVVFTAISSLDTVTSGCCDKPNMNKQKNYVLQVCGPYIMAPNTRRLPPRNDSCCAAVRTLQKKGAGMMQCVIDRLTEAESRQYDPTAMLYLTGYCTQRSSFAVPSAEVKIMLFMILFIHHTSSTQHASLGEES